MNNTFSNLAKRQEGFTAVEIVTVLAVLSVVAYLVLPLIFPGDALSTQEKAAKDLSQISQVLKERERIAKLNGNIEGIQIGNPGAYSQYTRVSFDIEVDPTAEELRYCLTGIVDDTVFYLDSITETTSSTPAGFCLGEEIAPPADGEAADSTEAPAGGEVPTTPEDGSAPADESAPDVEQ